MADNTQISTARQGFTRQRSILVSTPYLELFRCETVGSSVPLECLTQYKDTKPLCQVRSQHWAKAGRFIPSLKAWASALERKQQ
jgi:hypothetical protein